MPVFLDPGELEAQGEALEKHRGEILRARYLHQVTAFPAVRALFKRLQSDGKQIAIASSAKKGELAKDKQLAQIEGSHRCGDFLGRRQKEQAASQHFRRP